MPKVIGFKPFWLSKPATGYKVFAPAPTTTNGNARSVGKSDVLGPRRTVARRGTEVFVAVGREIRWADLLQLKEEWTRKDAHKFTASRSKRAPSVGAEDDDLQQGYRVIKTPVADDIRQLVISPNGDYMAILTTYTIHIAVLPSSSHLSTPDTTPMRLKTYTLGPTTHVTTRSPVMSALWHPLGVNGSCLVTVTEDATVRVWELSTTDRWSFDSPALSIDLWRLADGHSLDEDFTATRSKGFSPDSVEMAVASACFGGRGTGDWSPMTLWIAMREGDVYALCPLLPEKWAPPATLIPSLSVSIVSKVAAIEDDPHVSDQQKRLSRQQMAWMSCLDDQEPVMVDSPNGEGESAVYTRPTKPGKVPKLQGPFQIDYSPEVTMEEDDTVYQLSDIFFIGPKTNSDELVEDEEFELEMDDADIEGLSAGIVCLSTSSGRVMICLDLDGVEAQWLPYANQKVDRRLESVPSLTTFDIMETLRPGERSEDNWPVFSPDVNSRYAFFLTSKASITFCSLSPWVFRLETELSGESSAGADFRMDLLVDGERSIRERIYSQEQSDDSILSACFVFRDPDLGYFLLSTDSYGPVALVMEPPELEDTNFQPDEPEESEHERDVQPLMLWEPRPVYEPSHALDQASALPGFLTDLRRSKYKRLIQEEIRLSPATLTILTDAHKILSEETHRLGLSVADLFRQCERLQSELREQIARVSELSHRVDAVTGDDNDDPTVLGGDEGVEKRLQNCQKRQIQLMDRYEKLRKRVLHAGRSRELSDREKAWLEEVATLQTAVLSEKAEGGDKGKREGGRQPDERPRSAHSTSQLWRRLQEASRLKEELVAQARRISAATSKQGTESPAGSRARSSSPFGDEIGGTPAKHRASMTGVRVSHDTRQRKLDEVMLLLERETALVDATKGRLERLTIS